MLINAHPSTIRTAQHQSFAVSTIGDLWLKEAIQMGQDLFSVLSFTAPTIPESRQHAKKKTLVELLKEWKAEDPTEQRETMSYLVKVLDEDRLSGRKLFK